MKTGLRARQIIARLLKLNVIEARNQARASRDFDEADRIRDQLAEMGIKLLDGPDGTLGASLKAIRQKLDLRLPCK